ncbi:MAG: hypothetical protein HYR90_04690 [Candidatus Andersenbacteria bacterium]|nr:hypothetical protein [Candidatus Andersenbacteria bacterium]
MSGQNGVRKQRRSVDSLVVTAGQIREYCSRKNKRLRSADRDLPLCVLEGIGQSKGWSEISNDTELVVAEVVQSRAAEGVLQRDVWLSTSREKLAAAGRRPLKMPRNHRQRVEIAMHALCGN